MIANPTDQMTASVSIILPLLLNGVISYLDMSVPTLDSWTSGNYLWLNLTLDTLTWDPYSLAYSEMEMTVTDFQGHIVDNSILNGGHGFFISSITMTTTAPAADFINNCNLYLILQSPVKIALLDCCCKRYIFDQRSVDHVTLSGRCLITPDPAKLTVDHMTQQCVKSEDLWWLYPLMTVPHKWSTPCFLARLPMTATKLHIVLPPYLGGLVPFPWLQKVPHTMPSPSYTANMVSPLPWL